MRYSVQCCKCGQSFPFDFSKEGIFPDSCPYCHTNFEPHEVSKINDLLDKLDSYNQQFHSIKIKRVFEPSLECIRDSQMADAVLTSDIQCLLDLYRKSSTDQRELISGIIDKLYLLINRDYRTNDDTFASSQRVYDLLKAEFESSINLRNKEFSETLDDDL